MKDKDISLFAAKRSHRQLKVGEELRHQLSLSLSKGELREPALFNRSFTITEVKVSPDLKNATVYYVPLLSSSLSEEDHQKIAEGFVHASSYLRTQIAQILRLRVTPKLTFIYDKTFDNMDEVTRLLNNPRVQQDILKQEK